MISLSHGMDLVGVRTPSRAQMRPSQGLSLIMHVSIRRILMVMCHPPVPGSESRTSMVGLDSGRTRVALKSAPPNARTGVGGKHPPRDCAARRGPHLQADGESMRLDQNLEPLLTQQRCTTLISVPFIGGKPQRVGAGKTTSRPTTPSSCPWCKTRRRPQVSYPARPSGHSSYLCSFSVTATRRG